jgi:hypothetical protein
VACLACVLHMQLRGWCEFQVTIPMPALLMHPQKYATEQPTTGSSCCVESLHDFSTAVLPAIVCSKSHILCLGLATMQLQAIRAVQCAAQCWTAAAASSGCHYRPSAPTTSQASSQTRLLQLQQLLLAGWPCHPATTSCHQQQQQTTQQQACLTAPSWVRATSWIATWALPPTAARPWLLAAPLMWRWRWHAARRHAGQPSYGPQDTTQRCGVLLLPLLQGSCSKPHVLAALHIYSTLLVSYSLSGRLHALLAMMRGSHSCKIWAGAGCLHHQQLSQVVLCCAAAGWAGHGLLLLQQCGSGGSRSTGRRQQKRLLCGAMCGDVMLACMSMCSAIAGIE